MEPFFCPLFSGSTGNATLLVAGRARILIDAGLSARTVVASLEQAGVAPGSLTGLLITHEHSDHTQGVGAISRKYNLPVYANAATWAAMEQRVGDIALRNKRIFATGQDFYLQDVNVTPFPIPHDAADPVAYTFVHQGCKITLMTDIGHVNANMLDMAAHSQWLLIESNHDVEMLKSGKYPAVLKRRILGRSGHLSNDDCAKALVQLYQRQVRNVILGHLSRENNLESLALETVTAALLEQGIVAGRDMSLRVAQHYGPGVIAPDASHDVKEAALAQKIGVVFSN